MYVEFYYFLERISRGGTLAVGIDAIITQILTQNRKKAGGGSGGNRTGKHPAPYNSVQTEVKGYATSTRNLSASRTYPNLSDADLALVPKTVTEGGKTLAVPTSDAQKIRIFDSVKAILNLANGCCKW